MPEIAALKTAQDKQLVGGNADVMEGENDATFHHAPLVHNPGDYVTYTAVVVAAKPEIATPVQKKEDFALPTVAEYAVSLLVVPQVPSVTQSVEHTVGVSVA